MSDLLETIGGGDLLKTMEAEITRLRAELDAALTDIRAQAFLDRVKNEEFDRLFSRVERAEAEVIKLRESTNERIDASLGQESPQKIANLRAALAEAREVLDPLAEAANKYDGTDDRVMQNAIVPIEHLRAARAFLERTK